jgi:hypothetical protein
MQLLARGLFPDALMFLCLGSSLIDDDGEDEKMPMSFFRGL